MAIDLEKLNQDIPLPDDLTIERVADAATMRECHGWIRGFPAGRSLGSLVTDLFTAHGFGLDSAWQHYIGFVSGKPVPGPRCSMPLGWRA